MHGKRTFCGMLALLILLSGCKTETPEDIKNTAAFLAMDTAMQITVYGEERVLNDAERRVRDLEALFSVTDAGSEIYAVNHFGPARLSEDTAALLSVGLSLCQRTGGALDLSVYPIVRAWGFTTGNYRIPEENELAELLNYVDYTQIDFAAENSTVALAPGMEIDLGSIAKGYTGDQLVQLLRNAGVTSALLDLGGNIQAVGVKPDGSPWKIAVKDPVGSGNLGVLNVRDCAVITSGGYERYFEENGQTYWHIIDPETGYPARNGLLSVTVVGKSGALCDGLSTALFVMGPDASAELWRNSSDFEAVFVQEDGKVSVTEGLEDSFSLIDSYADAPLTVIRRD